MNDQPSDLKSIVEAALFSSDTALTIKRITGMFPRGATPAKEEIEKVLEVLQEDYTDRGVVLRKIGNGYRFQTRQEYASWLGKLAESRPPRYSRALLETLAIIAYRQPVTRGDIEDIRGIVVSTDIMRTLLDREWIKQVGTRDVPGHPALFGTTREFLEYFDLASLKDLPDLNVEREMTEIAQELNVDLPLLQAEGQTEGDESSGDEETANENAGVNNETGSDIDEEFDDDLDLIVESNRSNDAPSDVYEDEIDDMDAEDVDEPGTTEITEPNKVVVASNPHGNVEIDEEMLVTEMGD